MQITTKQTARSRRQVLLGLCVTGAAAISAPAVWANQDAELYDPVPPPDSVFLRLLSIPADGTVQVGPATFDVGTPGQISTYQVLKGGTWPMRAGDMAVELDLAPGSSYSLALIPDAPGYVLFEDQIISDPRKCGLMLYNLSASPARLFVPSKDKEIPIIKGLASMAHKTRAVNAITVDLAVSADGVEITRFPKIKLQRRSHFSFVVAGTAGAYTAVSAENETV